MDRRPRVLVVDDEPLNLRLMSKGLGGEYQVVTAANGHEAITRIKEQEMDLILLDVMMPDINGFDVCRIVKANPRYAEVPVLFLSAMDTFEGARQGLDLGAIDYLAKPVDLELLKLRVRNLTDLKRRGDEVRAQRDLLAQRTGELEAALARVRQLEGVIPICMYCKKIKDDRESWQQLEQYVTQHSDVMFSHSACPDCFEKEMKAIAEELPHPDLPEEEPAAANRVLRAPFMETGPEPIRTENAPEKISFPLRPTMGASNNLHDLALHEIPLFRHVAPESLQGIIDRCTTRPLEAGEILLLPDCVNRELYILLSGRLRIHLHNAGSEPIAFLQPGEIAGELSVIDGNPTSAYVVADGPSRVMVMEQELVWSLATVSHAAACNLLTMLSGRLREANRCIAEKMVREYSFHSYGTVDALTGMHNRYWLDEALARMVNRSTRSGTALSVLMVDIDCFKEFNDTHGHLSGDRAIHTVAQTLLENLRPTVMAARYGGDEFLIAIPDIGAVKAVEVAERLRQKVREKEIPHVPHFLPPLTISVGVTEVRVGQGTEDVIAAADAALYRAKEKGRDSVSE